MCSRALSDASEAFANFLTRSATKRHGRSGTQSLLLPLRFHSARGTQFPDADQPAQTLPALVRLRCAASPPVVWNAKTKKKFSSDDMITYG